MVREWGVWWKRGQERKEPEKEDREGKEGKGEKERDKEFGAAIELMFLPLSPKDILYGLFLYMAMGGGKERTRGKRKGK
jgi:hypothetical protein